MGIHAKKIWHKIIDASTVPKDVAKRSIEKDPICLIKTAHKQNRINLQKISVTYHQFLLKKGDVVRFDRYKRVTGTKIHVLVTKNGLSISILCSPANFHDNTKFVDMLENVSGLLDRKLVKKIRVVYADKSYDTRRI